MRGREGGGGVAGGARPVRLLSACSPGASDYPGPAECCRAGEAEYAIVAAVVGGGRKETLASQGGRLGPTRGAHGGACFGPALGRMVNLELMHTGEGGGSELRQVSLQGKGQKTGPPFWGAGGLIPRWPE